MRKRNDKLLNVEFPEAVCSLYKWYEKRLKFTKSY